MTGEKIRSVEIESENLFLKKDFLGWRIVHPIKNEDGSINWPNLIFGGKRNGLILLVYILLAVLFGFGVWEMMASCRNMIANPHLYFDMLKLIP